jgi:hypothetical protein
MATIRLSLEQWNEIYNRLAEEYQHKPSVIIIAEVRRRVLGFRVRRHRDNFQRIPDIGVVDYDECICLDFDTAEQATFFRIKYL